MAIGSNILIAAAATLAMAAGAVAEPTRIYIAPDDHTDLMWSANEEQYLDYFGNALDQYLVQIADTAAAPADQRMRWVNDGSIWLSTYEATRPAAAGDRWRPI